MVICPMEKKHAKGAAELEIKNFSTPWTEQDFLDEIAMSDRTSYFVALDGDRVVGTCGAIISFDEADIMNVSVDPEYQGQGIATKLMEATMEEARQKGVKNFTLEVRTGNVPARKLYEKLGFACVGVRPRFYSAPQEDAAIYWLR